MLIDPEELSFLIFSYVPNLGTDKKGILVSIGGATDQRYVDNSVLDVYDIGAQGWTKQSTLGDTMGKVRLIRSFRLHSTDSFPSLLQ
jgi:hypothetical protein